MYVVIREPTDAPSSVTNARREVRCGGASRSGQRSMAEQPARGAGVHERGGQVAENRGTRAADDVDRKRAGVGERHDDEHDEQPQADAHGGERRRRPAPSQGDRAGHDKNGQHAGQSHRTSHNAWRRSRNVAGPPQRGRAE